MENSELGSLVGGVGSAAVGISSFLAQLPYVGSLFLVLMTVSFTYYFNSRISSSARKYERGRLQTIEVLGPVYGQITSNLEFLEKRKAELSMDIVVPSGNDWAGIRHSYKVELIDGKLRSSMEQFFFDLDRLNSLVGPAVEMLRRIEKEEWESILGPVRGNDGGHLYYLIDDYRHERTGLVYGAVFWEKDPAKQFNMKWKGVAIAKGVNEYGGPINLDPGEIPGIMGRFLPEAGEKASKNLEVVNARAEYERILEEGYDLRRHLQKLISQWAKP